MNDINEMPPKCQYCPYWEVCEYPWVCPDREQLATNLKQTCSATDTISRQAAKLKMARVIWEDGDSCYDFHDKCIDCLDDLPSAQPEIIHCAECKWFQCNMRPDGYLPKGVEEYECRHWCGCCDPVDFCSYAERRTDG